MPTFAQNFQPGDIVYGLSLARQQYIDSLPPHLAQQCRDGGNFITCDEFNNRTFLAVGDEAKKNPMNAKTVKGNVKLHLKKWTGTDGEHVLTKSQQKALKDFFSVLCDSKYSVSKTAKSAVGGKVAGKADLLPMVLIRKACKFGLEYVIMQKQKTVHFSLDHFDHGTQTLKPMNQQDVVQKKIRGSDVSPPITTSELRCCFRNREKWMPTGRLKFYLNLQEVPPPWVIDKAIWREYEYHRIHKAANGLTKL